MSNLQFRKATKSQAKIRMALIGPAGAGKTFSSLNIASHLGNKIAVIDTERGSASKYSGEFQFDVLELDNFTPQNYVAAIRAAEEAGYDTLIIDSLSHAWMGAGGALDMVDKAAKRSQTHNTFGAWRDVTPHHNAMVDAILAANMHVFATMRAKTEYVQEKDARTGKTTVRKIGLAPVQKDGLEYEFDVVADLSLENDLIVGKTRCTALSGMVFHKAGADVAGILKKWLTDGTEAKKQPPELRDATADDAQSSTRLESLREEAGHLLEKLDKLGQKAKEAAPDANEKQLTAFINAYKAKIAELEAAKPKSGEDFENAPKHIASLVNAANDAGLDMADDEGRIAATNAFFEGTPHGGIESWLTMLPAPAIALKEAIKDGSFKW